jgi:peptidoglycan/xylan/chitin deacetylase (PgdA/CDA1 family)
MRFLNAKNGLVRLLATRPLARVLAARAGSPLLVVMMHRFASPEGMPNGHDAQALRHTLADLRRSGVEFVDIEQALEEYASDLHARDTGRERGPRIAFTVDDGYADAVEVAGPVFAEFDCPVTCFVPPDIVDGRDWYWWDKVDTVLRTAARKSFDVGHGPHTHSISLNGSDDQAKAFDEICRLIKQLPEDAVTAFIDQLARNAEVALPAVSPNRYRLLSWEEMRRAESRGWRFGAHTMTHPVLSQCTDSRASWEIATSLRVVRERLANPSGVFCYPVGRAGDFGPREYEILRAEGVRWALSASPGRLASTPMPLPGDDWRLRIPRIGHEDRRGGLTRHLLLP